MFTLDRRQRRSEPVGSDTVRVLIGAGGPLEWVADAPWPLHQVVVELHRSSAAEHVLPADLELAPRPGVGLHVDGIEAALHDLARSGELSLVDEGVFSCWRVTEDVVPAYRQMLMGLPPEEAAALYLAGRRWAALATTSLKKLRTASRSAGSTSRSSTPILRQLDTSTLRY